MTTAGHRFTIMTLIILHALTACSDAVHESPNDDAPITVRVMTFNIEWGGANVDFSKVVEAIRLSSADLVGIQEAEGNLQRLAIELGWHYNLRNYAISRFPLVEPPNADGHYVLVEVAPGKVVALANIHLPSDPYGPDRVRDGASLEDVIELERTVRLPKIAPLLRELGPLIKLDVPVFLTGDFNAPAHTDWTETMIGARPFIRYAVEWPVSKEVTAAGFKDAWRTVHPNPKTHPGLTWWARRPPLPTYAPDENDAEDRIDFVWFAGPAEAVNSVIVGEAGVASVSISVTPWPSDHRGVVSTFTVIPADTPPLISTSHRIYELGDDVELVYHGLNGASIQLARLQDDREIMLLDESPANVDGRIQIRSDRFSAGRYLVRTRHENNSSMQKEFWVIDPSLAASVKVKGDAFAAGQGIPVSWQNAPGNRNDYVSVVHLETGAASEDGLAWSYVEALPEGELVLDDSNAEWGWPLPPGKYVIRLMKDDGYEALAESSIFEVE
jgi:endonuclease/exonuclease/phosphatase family metal-dependent hydrolase